MTQNDLDFLKKYLDIKVAHCNISETQAQDIYDMMRINCLEEPITEEELNRLAKEEADTYGMCFLDSGIHTSRNREGGFYDGFIAGFNKTLKKYETSII